MRMMEDTPMLLRAELYVPKQALRVGELALFNTMTEEAYYSPIHKWLANPIDIGTLNIPKRKEYGYDHTSHNSFIDNANLLEAYAGVQNRIEELCQECDIDFDAMSSQLSAVITRLEKAETPREKKRNTHTFPRPSLRL
jgi:hypothetical protein